MAIDTMPLALDMAFRTALLLTGATKSAEAAVIHGISAREELSPHGLLTEAPVMRQAEHCERLRPL